MARLLEFYGRECPHCEEMHPLVERLEKEETVKVEKYEVWHDKGNAALMKKYATGLCEGVPFFWNGETKKHICGSTDYEAFKKWALGQ